MPSLSNRNFPRIALSLLTLCLSQVLCGADSDCLCPCNEAATEQDIRVFGGMPRSLDDVETLAVLDNQAFIVGYDTERRVPVWVAYFLDSCPSDCRITGGETAWFQVDERVTASSPTSFNAADTGLERGQLAPNAAIARCYGPDAQRKTFLMSNIAPQEPELNSGPWKRLEQDVLGSWARRGKGVWVITGTAYEQEEERVVLDGFSNEACPAIPDYFYKILVAPGPEDIVSLAYLMPRTVLQETPHSDFVTSIDRIEELTSLDFLWKLDDSVEKRLESSSGISSATIDTSFATSSIYGELVDTGSSVEVRGTLRQALSDTSKSFLERFAAPISTIVTALTAAIGGLIALSRWLHDRRLAREQEARHYRSLREQADLRLRQQRSSAAASLIKDITNVNAANQPWYAMALSLYPEETASLLVAMLGQSEEEASRNAYRALSSLGLNAISELARANRVSVLLCAEQGEETDWTVESPYSPEEAERLLVLTKRLIKLALLNASTSELAELSLRGVSLEGINLGSADLSAVNLAGVNLDKSVLTNARLISANLTNTSLEGTSLSGANLRHAKLDRARGAAQLKAVRAVGCSFKDVYLSGANLSGAHLESAAFVGANLQRSNVTKARFTGALFRNSQMGGIVGRGVQFGEARLLKTRLPNAALPGVNVSRSRISDCQLTGLSSIGMIAHNTVFEDCDLGGADIRKSDLSHATFKKCNLGGAKLTGSNLCSTIFEDCIFSGASLDAIADFTAHFVGTNVRMNRPVTIDNTVILQAEFGRLSREFREELFEDQGISN